MGCVCLYGFAFELSNLAFRRASPLPYEYSHNSSQPHINRRHHPCLLINALLVSHPHYPTPRTTTLASLVKGRWIDGKAQTFLCCFLLAILRHFYTANLSAVKTEGLLSYRTINEIFRIITIAFCRGGACPSRNIIVIIINNSKEIQCKKELHFTLDT